MDTGLPGFTLQAQANRLRTIRDRIEQIDALQASLIIYLEDNGCRVMAAHWAVNAVRAIVPVSIVPAISDRSDVRLIHETEVARPASVDFVETRRYTQSEFYRRSRGSPATSFEGQRSSGRTAAPHIYVAVPDTAKFNDNHYAFKDSVGSWRIFNRWNCAVTPCQEGSLNANATGDHGTKVAGIIAQDIMHNQDTTYGGDTDRLLRSGIASAVDLCLISADGGFTEEIEAAIVENVDIVSMSLASAVGRYCLVDGFYVWNPSCPTPSQARGDDSASIAVNAALDTGIFFVTAADNNGVDCMCDEQVGTPANAAGAFAVGAYDATGENPVSSFDTTGLKADRSSTGPAMDGRIKPDIAAPTLIEYTLSVSYDYGTGAYEAPATSNGTSWATPVVGGAAAVFKDWVVFTFGQSAANNPSRIFVNMLNFGDRKNETLVGSNQFSQYYGAGRLRMRLPIQAGMDSPWRWDTGAIEISDGETVVHWLGPDNAPTDPISDDVKFLKIAFWWFEPNVAEGAPKPRISVDLCQGNLLFFCETHGSGDDQKIHFVRDSNEANFDDFIGNRRYKFLLSGDYIPSGTRTVYWAYFWEDLDRDDGDGPCNTCGTDNVNYLFYR